MLVNYADRDEAPPRRNGQYAGNLHKLAFCLHLFVFCEFDSRKPEKAEGLFAHRIRHNVADRNSRYFRLSPVFVSGDSL